MITNDAVILGMLAAILGGVLWTASREDGFWKKFYSYVPALLLCYLLPSLLNTLGVIDGAGSKLYPVARDYLLPSSLVLLCVAIDFKAIVRLGPKAIIMFLTGTAGVMLGTERGTMQGHYVMIDEEGSAFNVDIPVFRLAVQTHIH